MSPQILFFLKLASKKILLLAVFFHASSGSKIGAQLGGTRGKINYRKIDAFIISAASAGWRLVHHIGSSSVVNYHKRKRSGDRDTVRPCRPNHRFHISQRLAGNRGSAMNLQTRTSVYERLWSDVRKISNKMNVLIAYRIKSFKTIQQNYMRHLLDATSASPTYLSER